MIPDKLRRYLEERGAAYRVVSHDRAWTAQEVAQAAHVSGRRMCKTVLLRCMDSAAAPPFYLAVLPANERVDVQRLAEIVGRPLELASEAELEYAFPDWELGAVPPIAARAAGIPVIVDSALAECSTLAMNAGTHTDVIELSWADFQRLTGPIVAQYGRPARFEFDDEAPPR